MKRRIIAAENADALHRLAAEILADITIKAIEARGRAVLLLSGGSTVRVPYERFGKSTLVDWSKVYIFWGDDRFVEPDNPYSNYGLARDTLIANAVMLPAKNIYPISFSAKTPAECAEQYSATIRDFFGLTVGEWPAFDLAQNGMGPDGHTASIFPHSTAVNSTDDIAVTDHAGLGPWVDRITLTFPVFNNARSVLFIAAGAPKADTLKSVLEESPTISDRPAAYIRPANGQVIWLIDKAAASKLADPLENKY
jgi:6-phosphogluconolactonase